MSGSAEHEVPWLPVLDRPLLGSDTASTGGQLLGWFSSLVFHTAVLAALAWESSLETTRPKLPGNPEVVTLICSQASVASPPQKLEVKIPRPEEEPTEAPPLPEELPPVPEPQPPQPPRPDSLEVLHAAVRHQTPKRAEATPPRLQPAAAPLRKLLARAELKLPQLPPAQEPAPSPPQQAQTQQVAATPPKNQTAAHPRLRTARRMPTARQTQLPSPATRAAPLADAVGTDRTLAPRIVYRPDPVYPDIFPRPTGTVWLTLVIGKDGRVKSAKVYRSSGHPALDRAAQQGVLRWVWQPATRGGKPVAARVRVGVNFVDD